MRRRILCATFALALPLTLAACAGGAPPPKDRFYRLTLSAPAETYEVAPITGLLEVDRPSADGVTVERAIAYSKDPNQLTQYAYHYWVDPPPRLIQNAVVDALRDAGVAKAVVTPDHRALSDFTLQGRLTRFEHKRDGDPAAVLGVEFSLLNERDGRVVFLQAYEMTEPAADATVEAAVTAMSRAVSRMTAALVRDLGRF